MSGETYESPVGSPGRFPDGERAEGRARRTRRARRGRANGHEWRRQRGRKTTLESARGDDARVREATRETMVTAAAAAALDRLPRDCLLKVCEFLDTTGVEALGIQGSLLPNLEVLAMVCIIICFAVGVGNVEGFIISEIMPVYAKDTLMSIGQPLNWIANLTVSTLFPILFVAMGRYAYLIFVALTAFFGWFTYTKLPETKGRTIAQVTEEFKRY